MKTKTDIQRKILSQSKTITKSFVIANAVTLSTGADNEKINSSSLFLKLKEKNTFALHFLLIFFLCAFSIFKAQAQILPVPVIDSISVTTENSVILSWNVTPDARVNRFVIYRKTAQGFGYIAIDTVLATPPFRYIDPTANPVEERWQYTVASLSASDSLSGLANHHSYLMFNFADFHLCQAEVDLSWVTYVGATNPQYSTICTIGNTLVDARQEGFGTQGSLSVRRGQEQRIAVRATWDGGSSTSAFKPYWADTVAIVRKSSISRIANEGQTFEVTVKNLPARDRDSVFLYQYRDFEAEPFAKNAQKPDAINEITFNVPVTNNITVFSPSVKDVCGLEYENNQSVGSIDLKSTDRNTHISLQWNDVRNIPNLSYKLFKDDGRVELIGEFTSGGSYQHQFGSTTDGAAKVCFRIQASNDTLEVFSNIVCVFLSDDLLWPNAFTPNGDGFDDRFGPVVNRFAPELYVLRVFDKHGMPLFVSNNVNDKWSGHYNGNLIPKGAYVWQSEYSIAGKQYKRNGTVTVIY
jgi:gliding motility-associated-like protein